MFSLYLHHGGVCQIQVSFTVNMERQICGIQGVTFHFTSMSKKLLETPKQLGPCPRRNWGY